MSTTLVASAFNSNPLWYTTRSTAVVGFVLLSIATVLGVASTQRALASRAWPRFATQTLHRNVSVLGLVFIVVHIVTTVADSYVKVSIGSAIVPFASSYKTVDVMWGTVAFDLLLIIVATGYLRVRMTEPVWRAIHLASYVAWTLGAVHFISTGTDGAVTKWGFWVAVVATCAVAAAAVLRVLTSNQPRGPVRSVTRRS
jgi:sulfoxide reductase heme-binding subunit YedZ